MKKLEQVKTFINEKIRENYEYLGQEIYFAFWKADMDNEKISFKREYQEVKNVEEINGQLELLYEIIDKIDEIEDKEVKENE